MTDDTQTKPKRASKAKTPVTPTDYVVMEKVDVIPATKITDVFDVPQGVEPNEFTAELWRPTDTLTATGQEKTLIEKWAAEKKRTGTFKLNPARSWKGGVRVFEKTELTSEAIA